MRDEPMPGRDLAIYWVEHVLRHGGAKHLQIAAKDVPLYQRHMIDVSLFLVVVASIVLLAAAWIVSATVRRCCDLSTTFDNKLTTAKPKTN